MNNYAGAKSISVHIFLSDWAKNDIECRKKADNNFNVHVTKGVFYHYGGTTVRETNEKNILLRENKYSENMINLWKANPYNNHGLCPIDIIRSRIRYS